ncbi:guanine-N(7)-methyltransferase [Auricularia subglabra TFB-10046 SS5]|nr:guanine-N(7)-methyltransferase [Auricularia subglabra TFB-10046 SS5]
MSTIPYAPTHRISPPGTVLVPLTQADLQRFLHPKNRLRAPGTARKAIEAIYERTGLMPLLRGEHNTDKKRPRDPDAPGSSRPAKRTRDSGQVMEHYNKRANVSVDQRVESPIIGLKNFNNWIKSVLIAKFTRTLFEAGRGDPAKGRVLDMGCGKGGDLQKWSKARVAEYVGLDIAAVSVDQARDRWQSMKGRRFRATFAAVDCFTESIDSVLPPEVHKVPFDVVSMQFCMHYAFESQAKTEMMLSNVATHLRAGGIFLGTIPNSAQLMDRLDELPEDTPPDQLAWGNSVYRIKFDSRDNRPLYGQRYRFYLEDAVDDVPEYVVDWPNFLALAAKHGLQLLYREEFHDVFEAERDDAEFGPLLQRMRVVDAEGESHMDEDQWEAASTPHPAARLPEVPATDVYADIYIAFAFIKRDPDEDEEEAYDPSLV